MNELEPSSLSTKWVSTSSEPSEQGAVVVHPDSNTVIDSFPSRPLNFVTIFGPARSGKSFVMNALARRNGVFRVSPAAASCTSGVDLSKTVVSLEEFTGGAAKGKYEDMPHIGFVDVEGLGDKDPSHHVKLAIPPMLVSKVQCANIPMASPPLDRSDIFLSSAKILLHCRHGQFPAPVIHSN